MSDGKNEGPACHDETFRISQFPAILKEAAISWNNSAPFRLSAIIAYYAVLSMPALIVIIVNLLGVIWGNEIVEGRLSAELSGIIGKDTATSVSHMIENSMTGDKHWLLTLMGLGSLLYGATGVFYHLQISLNSIWGIKLDPDSSWKRLVKDRVLSFGFVLVLGFLLLISFVFSTLLTGLSEQLKRIFPDLVVELVQVADLALSIGVISLLFALIFKFLPHAKIQWKSVWVGAIVTSLLFALGKYALGFYFSAADPGSTYGAAGSIILVLLWVSYASIILFFGAEVTYVFAKRYGRGVRPIKAAVKKEIVE